MNLVENFESFFGGNPYLNAISFLLAILGIFFTVYFYLKSQRVRKPMYVMRTVNLVRENIQKMGRINILYDGKAVNNLSVTKIALWNDGKETVNNSDVAKKNPLKLSIRNDCAFLDVEMIYQKNPSNGFDVSISEDHKFVNITFDYFDFEEGIVLQTFHTGNKSSDICLEGQVKSVKEIQRNGSFSPFLSLFIVDVLRQTTIPYRKAKMLVNWTIFFIGLLSICLSIVLMFIETNPIKSDPETDRILLVISLGAIGLLYFFIGYNGIKRNIPKGFDVFNEEFLKEEKEDKFE